MKGLVKFGWRTLSGIGTAVDDIHPNVVRLAIELDLLARFVLWLRDTVPPRLRPCLLRRLSIVLPDCLLPPTVIVKRLKEGWDEEFDNEKHMYQKLQRLQGTVLPICYGEASVGGTRALVLSDVGGVPMNDRLAPPIMDPEHFRETLEDAYRVLHEARVTQGDHKLDNLHCIGGGGGSSRDRIVFLDLEYLRDLEADEDPAEVTKGYADHFVGHYKGHLEFLRYEGIAPQPDA